MVNSWDEQSEVEWVERRASTGQKKCSSSKCRSQDGTGLSGKARFAIVNRCSAMMARRCLEISADCGRPVYDR